ncbi:MAG: pentapeptide repeat-containing protein [Cyanobacteria bacterium J06581_3]
MTVAIFSTFLFLAIVCLDRAVPEAIAMSARPALTQALLAERIDNPVRQGGATVVDLTGFNIDLRPEQRLDKGTKPADFSEQFYQQLQNALSAKQQNSKRYLGIDLSDALIQGSFNLSRLSRRIPAYGDASLPQLETFKQTYQLQTYQPQIGPLTTDRIDRSYTNRSYTNRAYSRRLSRFLLPPTQTVQPDTLIFQGPLLLNQACFNSTFDASNIYFFNRVEAQGTIFTQMAQWQGVKFAQNALFSQSQFQQESSFRGALFTGRTRFNQARFGGESNWKSVDFQGSAGFADTDFQTALFARSHWKTNADFERAKFHGTTRFQKSRFDQALFLTDAVIEKSMNFSQAQFQQPISLRAAHILGQLDFGDARFAAAPSGNASSAITINVADLDFSPGDAKILGSAGRIGNLFSVPTLTNNETVLRSLVRNFRLQEQIGDANQLEYSLEKLRLAQLKRQLLGTSLNQASQYQLMQLGLSAEQAAAVVAQRTQQPFVSRADLLSLDEIDLATYLQVRDRITSRTSSLINRLQRLLQWMLLACLLQLSHYGTNVGLTFSVGMVSVTLFALMFWLVDRYRRLTPTPIIPGKDESLVMGIGGGSVLAIALGLMVHSSQQPGATLATVGLLTVPIPGILLVRLYQQGRYHDLMDRSYFVENGALRKLQVLIARLPVTPKFPFYRERYSPLLSDRRWNGLNYFDLSLNNWFKFGFNDIRLRDKCVPGLISTLVWYQWSLGVIYITLLLWTLSRTIPGLNLLLYF